MLTWANIQSSDHCFFRADLTWVVGFTNHNLQTSCVMSSIPEFILQMYFKVINDTTNAPLQALIHSCSSKRVLDHTGILLIELLSPSSIHASVREVIRSTPNMPWAIPFIVAE